MWQHSQALELAHVPKSEWASVTMSANWRSTDCANSTQRVHLFRIPLIAQARWYGVPVKIYYCNSSLLEPRLSVLVLVRILHFFWRPLRIAEAWRPKSSSCTHTQLVLQKNANLPLSVFPWLYGNGEGECVCVAGAFQHCSEVFPQNFPLEAETSAQDRTAENGIERDTQKSNDNPSCTLAVAHLPFSTLGYFWPGGTGCGDPGIWDRPMPHHGEHKHRTAKKRCDTPRLAQGGPKLCNICMTARCRSADGKRHRT